VNEISFAFFGEAHAHARFFAIDNQVNLSISSIRDGKRAAAMITITTTYRALRTVEDVDFTKPDMERRASQCAYQRSMSGIRFQEFSRQQPKMVIFHNIL